MVAAPASPVVVFDRVGVLRDDSVLLLEASGSVGAGEVLAITGANGSGKTTQGDLSVLVMLAWQADAVIVPLLAAALLLAVLPLGQLAVLGVAAALAALLGLLAARRLRALES